MESIAQLLGSSYYIQAVPTYLAMRCSDSKTNGRDCSDNGESVIPQC